MKILVSGGLAPSLILFRGPLLRDLRAAGHSVVACAAESDPVVAAALAVMGIRYQPVPIARTGLNPLADLRYLWSLCRLVRREAPDVVLAYTHKPVIYTTLAARLASRHCRAYGMVEGLGYAFIATSRGLKPRLARCIVQGLYRMSSRFLTGIFFLNADDQDVFRSQRLLPPTLPQWIVRGAGVDLAYYTPAPMPGGPHRFLLVARLLADKGIREYVAAAQRIRQEFPDIQFDLVGPTDPNPAAIQPDEVQAWARDGLMNYHGNSDDVRPFFKACFAYVLPSYREGIPRTVLEAMATGRAVITTSAPGCRETVFPGPTGFVTDGPNQVGINGLLVPVQNVEALAHAMRRLLTNPAEAASMGRAGRQLVETHFEAHQVSRAMMEAMQLL